MGFVLFCSVKTRKEVETQFCGVGEWTENAFSDQEARSLVKTRSRSPQIARPLIREGTVNYENERIKFSAAIEALATSSHATIQQRLAIAYLLHLRSIKPNNLPKTIAPQFQKLKDKLNLLATQNLLLQDAVEIAKDLVNMHHTLTDHHPTNQRRKAS